jgi:hypothetical protein
MLPDEKIGCHRLARKCRDGVVNEYCQLWTNVRGRDPQSGELIDRWGCADAFAPMLATEAAQQMRQVGAAVESFRNEVVKAGEAETAQRLELLGRLIPSGLKVLE